MIGTSFNLLIPEIHRAHHQKEVTQFAQGDPISRHMGKRETPIYGKRKNGEEFHVDASISKLEINGQKILTVVLRDITESKRIENEKKFLADVGTVLSSTLDYDCTLENIAQLTTRNLADFCIIYAIQPNGKIKRSKAVSRESGKAWVCDLLMQIPIDSKSPGPIGQALTTRQSVLIENLSDEIIKSFSYDEDHHQTLRTAELKSMIISPLLIHGELMGVIGLFKASPSRHYKHDDLQLIEELAQRSSIAMNNARLYRYTMLELLGPELYEKNRPFIQAAFRGEKQTFEIDIPFKSSGDIRHTNTTFVPEISHNQVNGFFAMVMDVTELKDAQLKALEAVRTREDVLAIVSHDLKNPLTTMGLISDMLDKVDDLSKVHIFSKKI